jgi:hypothetical protein
MGPSSASTPSYASACGHDYWAQNPQPSSAGIVDSQSAKTTGVGGNERGLDPAKKKVEGTKRHLLVWDTEGLVLKVHLHSAKVPDQEDGISRLLLGPVRRSPCAPFHTCCGSMLASGGGAGGGGL